MIPALHPLERPLLIPRKQVSEGEGTRSVLLLNILHNTWKKGGSSRQTVLFGTNDTVSKITDSSGSSFFFALSRLKMDGFGEPRFAAESGLRFQVKFAVWLRSGKHSTTGVLMWLASVEGSR